MPAATALGYTGWAFFGILVRGFQLGIQARPLNFNKIGYVYSAALWTGFGYYFYKVVDGNDAILDTRISQLQEAREQRDAKVKQNLASTSN